MVNIRDRATFRFSTFVGQNLWSCAALQAAPCLLIISYNNLPWEGANPSAPAPFIRIRRSDLQLDLLKTLAQSFWVKMNPYVDAISPDRPRRLSACRERARMHNAACFSSWQAGSPQHFVCIPYASYDLPVLKFVLYQACRLKAFCRYLKAVLLKAFCEWWDWEQTGVTDTNTVNLPTVLLFSAILIMFIHFDLPRQQWSWHACMKKKIHSNMTVSRLHAMHAQNKCAS